MQLWTAAIREVFSEYQHYWQQLLSHDDLRLRHWGPYWLVRQHLTPIHINLGSNERFLAKMNSHKWSGSTSSLTVTSSPSTQTFSILTHWPTVQLQRNIVYDAVGSQGFLQETSSRWYRSPSRNAAWSWRLSALCCVWCKLPLLSPPQVRLSRLALALEVEVNGPQQHFNSPITQLGPILAVGSTMTFQTRQGPFESKGLDFWPKDVR